MAKRTALYGILTALCMVLGYLEGLLPLDFIAPGIRLGLANTLPLLLIARRDIKGAFAVNLVRILLTALLFGNLTSLIFSLSGGLASLVTMALLSRLKRLSPVGLGIAGGAVHNLFQLVAAFFLVGHGVLWYLPPLLLCGGLCGVLTGTAGSLILKYVGPKPTVD